MTDLIVSASPHIRKRTSTRRIMIDVVIALLPCVVASIVFFGWYALAIEAIAVVTAVATELVYAMIYRKCWKDFGGTLKQLVKEFDFTSVVTGIILALCLPVAYATKDANNVDVMLFLPWYIPFLGSIFAIALCKMLFGGTGRNLVNPADTGRVFLFISFTAMLSSCVGTCSGFALAGGAPLLDGENMTVLASATPLTALVGEKHVLTLSPLDLFLGTGVDGMLGETCKIAILAGFVYLAVRRVIKWYYPLIYIGVAGVFAVMLEGFNFAAFLPSILSGGLMFGAVFMATDYVTSPKSTLANVIYYVCLGLLTAGLRKATGMETTSFCILIMNCLTPLIDRYVPRRPFGYVRVKKEKKSKEDKA